MKTLDHYICLDYPISMLRHVNPKNDSVYWVAKHFDLPGCMSDGETPDEAISNLDDAKQVWIESYLEDGLEVPEPSKDYNETEYEDRLFFDIEGKEYCNDELALSILLKDDVIFANAFDYSYGNEVISGHTVVLFVVCNDVFEWGFADAESFSTSDIGPLIKAHLRDKRWGATKWAALHRQYRPQPPVENAMREAGVWDDDLEKLERSHSLE